MLIALICGCFAETPNCDVIQAQWRVLEDAQRDGVVGALGVVNYCEKQIDCLLKMARVKPALDYYCFASRHGPRCPCASGPTRPSEASKPLRTVRSASPGLAVQILEGDVLTRPGQKYGVSSAQVAVRWNLQNGNAVSARPTAEFGLGVSACRADGRAQAACGTAPSPWRALR